MAYKTYVLLEDSVPDVPVFQQLGNGQRVQVKNKPFHRPYLQLTVFDKDGVTKQLRYKANSNYIWQDLQMEKEKIDANAKWSQREYSDPMFKNASLTTNKKVLQDFLEANPECEGSPYSADDVKVTYRLYNREAESKVKNSETKLRIQAANKIINLELEEAKSMLIRLNGSIFKTPLDIEECQNLLLEFVDDTNEAGLSDILKDDKDITVDEKTSVLIGTLVNAGLLSFDQIDGKVSKKKGDEWLVVRELSSQYPLDERIRLFSNFLNTSDGKPLKSDLENALQTIGNGEVKRMGRPPKNG